MMFRLSKSFRKISKKTFLVESFEYILATLNSQSEIKQKKGSTTTRYFLEKFLTMDNSDKSEIAASNVIQFLTTTVSFSILL